MTKHSDRKFDPKKGILAWHFLPNNGRLYAHASNQFQLNDDREVKLQEPLSVKGPIVCCRNGLHASIKVTDALEHVRSAEDKRLLCRVRLTGKIREYWAKDKLVARTREVLWWVDAKEVVSEYKNWYYRRGDRNRYPTDREAEKKFLQLVEKAKKKAEKGSTTVKKAS